MSIKKKDLAASKKDHLPTTQPEEEKSSKIYKKICGLSHEESCMSMIQSTFEAFPKNVSVDMALSVTGQMLQDMAPADPIEGMLCSQIIGLNAQGMRYLARAESDENWICHTEAAVNMAVKLLRLKNETIEALTRYRRKGEQKVVVQHINVNDDAKAIIGDISSIVGGGNVKS